MVERSSQLKQFKYIREYGVNPKPVSVVPLTFSARINNREGYNETVFFPPAAVAKDILKGIVVTVDKNIGGFEWKNHYGKWNPAVFEPVENPNLPSLLKEKIESEWNVFKNPNSTSSLSKLELVTFESLSKILPIRYLFDLVFTCPTSWGGGSRVFDPRSNSFQMITSPTHRIEERHFLIRQRKLK